MSLLRIAVLTIALIMGGWMIFDGIHVLARGKYFGPPDPGPWSNLVVRVGVNPFSLGPLFIILGACWIAFLMAMLRGQPWGRTGAVVVAVASLWYVPVGTVLSALYLGLLWFDS